MRDVAPGSQLALALPAAAHSRSRRPVRMRAQDHLVSAAGTPVAVERPAPDAAPRHRARGGGLIVPNGDFVRRRAALKLLSAQDVADLAGVHVDTVHAVFASRRVNVRSVWAVAHVIEEAETPDPRVAAALGL